MGSRVLETQLDSLLVALHQQVEYPSLTPLEPHTQTHTHSTSLPSSPWLCLDTDQSVTWLCCMRDFMEDSRLLITLCVLLLSIYENFTDCYCLELNILNMAFEYVIVY